MEEIYCFDSRFDLDHSVEPESVPDMPEERFDRDVSAPSRPTSAVDPDTPLDVASFAHGTAAGPNNRPIPSFSALSPLSASAFTLPKATLNRPSIPDALIDPVLTRYDAAAPRRHSVSSSISHQESSEAQVSKRPSGGINSTLPSLKLENRLSPRVDHVCRSSRDGEEGHFSIPGESLAQAHEQVDYPAVPTLSFSSFKRKRTLRQQHSGHSLQNLAQSRSYTIASEPQHEAPDRRRISERSENRSSTAAQIYRNCKVWRTPDGRLIYVPLDAQPVGYVAADGQYYPAKSDHAQGEDRKAQYGAAGAQDDEDVSFVNEQKGVREPRYQYPIPSLGRYQMNYQHVDEPSGPGKTGSMKRKRTKREDRDLDLGGSGEEEDGSNSERRRPIKRRKAPTHATGSGALGQPSIQPLATMAAVPCFPGPYFPATQLPPANFGQATQPVMPAAAAGATLSGMAAGATAAATATTPLPSLTMPPPPPVATAAPPPVVTYNDVGITTKTGLSIWNQYPHLSAHTIIRYYPTEVRGGTLEYVRNELEREPNGSRHGSYLERVFAEEHGTSSIWRDVTFRQAVRISKKERALDAAQNPDRLPPCDNCKYLVLDCSLRDPKKDQNQPCTQCTDAQIHCT